MTSFVTFSRLLYDRLLFTTTPLISENPVVQIVPTTLDGLSFYGATDIITIQLKNIKDPELPQDAATKKYVDDIKSIISWKDPVYLSSTTDISILSAPLLFDGLTPYSNSRILIKNQLNNVENGIYVWVTGGISMIRTGDFPLGGNLLDYSASAIFVQTGLSNASTGWVETINTGIIGTNANEWDKFTSDGNNAAGNQNEIQYRGTLPGQFAASQELSFNPLDNTLNIGVYTDATFSMANNFYIFVETRTQAMASITFPGNVSTILFSGQNDNAALSLFTDINAGTVQFTGLGSVLNVNAFSTYFNTNILVGDTDSQGIILQGNSNIARILVNTSVLTIDYGAILDSTNLNFGYNIIHGDIGIGNEVIDGNISIGISITTGGFNIGGGSTDLISIHANTTTVSNILVIGNDSLQKLILTGGNSAEIMTNSVTTDLNLGSYNVYANLFLGKNITSGNIFLANDITDGNLIIGNNITTGSFILGGSLTNAISINANTTTFSDIIIVGNDTPQKLIITGGDEASIMTNDLTTICYIGSYNINNIMSLGANLISGYIYIGADLTTGSLILGNGITSGLFTLGGNSTNLISINAGTVAFSNTIVIGQDTIEKLILTGGITANIMTNNATTNFNIGSYNINANLFLGTNITSGNIFIGDNLTDGSLFIGNNIANGSFILGGVNTNTIEINSSTSIFSGNVIIDSSLNSTSQNTGALVVSGGVGVGGSVYATNFVSVSDIHLKTNIKPLENSIDILRKIESYSYNWKNENLDSNLQYGVIAQQLEEIGLNNLVYNSNSNSNSNSINSQKAVNYIGLIPILIESIKYLDNIITNNIMTKQ